MERLLVQGTLRTTVITRFELLSGAKTAKQRARLVHLLDGAPSLALDDAAADAASEIRKSLGRAGNAIGMADSLITGIAIANGGALF